MQVKTKLYSDKKPPNVEKKPEIIDKKGEKKLKSIMSYIIVLLMHSLTHSTNVYITSTLL